jgi:hypothetical protein
MMNFLRIRGSLFGGITNLSSLTRLGSSSLCLGSFTGSLLCFSGCSRLCSNELSSYRNPASSLACSLYLSIPDPSSFRNKTHACPATDPDSNLFCLCISRCSREGGPQPPPTFSSIRPLEQKWPRLQVRIRAF